MIGIVVAFVVGVVVGAVGVAISLLYDPDFTGWKKSGGNRP
jgi:hypothetical protein